GGPFVFVNPDLEAPPLRETLRELPELVASVGVDVDGLRHHHRGESELDANWKIVCENFLECYHCAVAHPAFSALVDVSPDAYQLVPGEAFSSQFGPVRENGGGLASEGEVARSQFHFLWPNTMINIFPGRTNLSIGPVLPAGAARTDGVLHDFFGPDADQAMDGGAPEIDAEVRGQDNEEAG